MLITQDPNWQGKYWPGPMVRVIRPAESTASGPWQGDDDKWVVFEVLDPKLRNVELLRQIVVKLTAYRQLGFGPLLYCQHVLADDAALDLLKRLNDDPNLVELHLDEATGDIVLLAAGANLVENPLFGRFFANLTHTASMPPDFLAKQMQRHLSVAETEGGFA